MHCNGTNVMDMLVCSARVRTCGFACVRWRVVLDVITRVDVFVGAVKRVEVFVSAVALSMCV